MGLEKKHIGFIGGGNMAEAMIGALTVSGIMDSSRIMACDVDTAKLEALKRKFGIETTLDSGHLFSVSDVVILAVKPQIMDTVLTSLTASDHFRITGRKLLISIAAGIPIARIEKLVYEGLDEEAVKNLPIIRVMPNTPSLVLEGMAGFCLNGTASDTDAETARLVLSSMGKTLAVTENQMDAVTAVSGSGPAYFFYMVESMVEAGSELGLSPEDALALTVQTMKGAAVLLEKSGDSPEILRKKVTSPGGTTEAAIRSFMETGFKESVRKGLASAAGRSKELSA
jgi:pyrroline-5-carboxylate reductase